MTTRWTARAASLGAAALLAACTSVDVPTPNLVEAQRLVQQAGSSGEVNRYASAELVQARDALNRAVQAERDRNDAPHVDHLGYLAGRKAQLAVERAAQRAAEARVDKAGAERERLRADLHTRQAQQAEPRASTREGSSSAP